MENVACLVSCLQSSSVDGVGSGIIGITQQGFYATDWATNDILVNGMTPQLFSVQLDAATIFDLNTLTDGQNYFGTADYSATVKLTGIELIDANGKLASGWTVTSSSGTVYNAIQGSSTPEPGTIAFLIGVASVGLVARRRKK